MKKIIILAIMAVITCSSGAAQTINWNMFREHKNNNMIELRVGYEFGTTVQIGYVYYIDGFRPLALQLDYSFPLGNIPFDDFKVRYGVQMELIDAAGFAVMAKIYSNFRRIGTPLVRILGFGSDFAVNAGYYSQGWHIAGEFGFDKSIITHFKHSDVMKSNYPGVHDGWYIPTGGNYYYGGEAGVSMGRGLSLSMRIGEQAAQFNDTNPVIPYYVQLGFGSQF